MPDVVRVDDVRHYFFAYFSEMVLKERIFFDWDMRGILRKDGFDMIGEKNMMDGIDVEKKEKQLPWWQKYTLTLNEASEYFGIGYKKLRLFCKEHANDDFILWNGNRAMIKREMFEKYLDANMNVI